MLLALRNNRPCRQKADHAQECIARCLAHQSATVESKGYQIAHWVLMQVVSYEIEVNLIITLQGVVFTKVNPTTFLTTPSERSDTTELVF